MFVLRQGFFFQQAERLQRCRYVSTCFTLRVFSFCPGMKWKSWINTTTPTQKVEVQMFLPRPFCWLMQLCWFRIPLVISLLFQGKLLIRVVKPFVPKFISNKKTWNRFMLNHWQRKTRVRPQKFLRWWQCFALPAQRLVFSFRSFTAWNVYKTCVKKCVSP